MPSPNGQYRITLGAATLLAALIAGAPAAVQAETRGYAISLIYTASHSEDDSCPRGGNGGPPEMKLRILQSRGYTKEQAFNIVASDDVDANGEKIDFRNRGMMDGKPVNVANFPLSYPDPQIETAQGRHAYGFNLDGKVDEHSFVDPETGEQGVDNQMWRVLGCFSNYMVKRPVIPYNESIVWDTAIDSMPAWLMSITAEDFSRDGEVTVTFDRGLNTVMRDAKGGVLLGSSYTVDPDPRSHTVFKGQLRNGVLTVDASEFFMQGESQFYAVLRMKQAKLRLTLNPDGSIYGVLGGYQPWLDYYHYLSIRGENDGLVDLPGVYYAMRRLADADPDPQTGQNRAISAAYYLEAAPVFHTNLEGGLTARAHIGSPDTQQADEQPVQARNADDTRPAAP